MRLMEMGFGNSPIPPPKTTLIGPKYHDFKNRHRGSMRTDYTSSYPAPDRFLYQKVSILSGKLITTCTNKIFTTVLPVILKSLLWIKVDEGQRIKSNVDTYIRIIHLYSTVTNLAYI